MFSDICSMERRSHYRPKCREACKSNQPEPTLNACSSHGTWITGPLGNPEFLRWVLTQVSRCAFGGAPLLMLKDLFKSSI